MLRATGSGPRCYSTNAGEYQLLEEVGHGASATVYRAVYLPFNEILAIKCLDFERCNSNLDDIRREAQIMSLIDHPNVVRAYCSFAVDKNLWVVMPFMAEGSCQHLMKTAYADGFEERAICSILKETLKALDYLHQQGHIHRDVKAGNILLDANGLVKLGDFGVSACMFDNGDRKRSRNTFVGTPCWMAPEVFQPGNGYDFKADIWSFGITALELALGHAPFSKHDPMKVLLMTIYNAPPGLDYEREKKFSKSFKEMVAMCLVKDPTRRPTCEKLLKHSCFKNAKLPELVVKKLFADLPPLRDRVKSLQLKDAAQVALKRMPSAEEEAMSQNEYKRGVSAWNFDVEDLKAHASLIQDDDDFPEIKEADESVKSAASNKDECESISGNSILILPADVVGRHGNENKPDSEKGIHDVCRVPSFSGPLMLPTRASANSLSAPIESSGYKDSLDDKAKSSLIQIKGRFSVTSEDIDYTKGSPLRKSFSVGDWISEPKQTTTHQPNKDICNAYVSMSSILPHLQNLFQQSVIQQDLIMSLLYSLQPSQEVDICQNGTLPPVPLSHSPLNGNVETPDREQLLLTKILELEARMINLTEELSCEKQKYLQLQEQLNVGLDPEEDDHTVEAVA